ncbi:MAG: hypothetical protein Q9162_003142 [Coniocarpon cinnabarinum]
MFKSQQANLETVLTNRGTAFILYEEMDEAEAAIAHMHEAQVDGAVINVSIVLPRRKFSRSPPPSRRLQVHMDRYNDRGPPYPRGPPPAPAPRYRSPPRRRYSPPRGGGRGQDHSPVLDQGHREGATRLHPVVGATLDLSHTLGHHRAVPQGEETIDGETVRQCHHLVEEEAEEEDEEVPVTKVTEATETDIAVPAEIDSAEGTRHWR